MINSFYTRGFGTVLFLVLIAVASVLLPDLALAQTTPEAEATTALQTIATAGTAIGAAMVAAAASLLVGRWVVAFIT